ncbi:MAG: hypothetical protein KDD67_14680 [Ignavibacteriae bacterium]|nr:hypothetical protein [Ignavibacteriota bacterium]MCB9215145.1 hypothetical protein [Ignavibacteria bacterium]
MSDIHSHLPTTPIPHIFRSHETGELYTNCIECFRSLLDSETEYLIEKAFRTYPGFAISDTVFEYAICMSCAEEITKSLSRESRTRLEQYFSSGINLQERMKWTEEENIDFGKWVATCAIKGTRVEGLTEYQVVAHCKGDQLILSVFPYLIGEEALNEMGELLSNETLEIFDDFGGRHFGLPPEFSDKLRPRFMPVL